MRYHICKYFSDECTVSTFKHACLVQNKTALVDNNNWLFRVLLLHPVRDFENAVPNNEGSRTPFLWRPTTFQIMSPSLSVVLKKQIKDANAS